MGSKPASWSAFENRRLVWTIPQHWISVIHHHFNLLHVFLKRWLKSRSSLTANKRTFSEDLQCTWKLCKNISTTFQALIFVWTIEYKHPGVRSWSRWLDVRLTYSKSSIIIYEFKFKEVGCLTQLCLIPWDSKQPFFQA